MFSIIDKNTGRYPNLEQIALKEDWAKNLIYCDMEGFFLSEDGNLILADECGNWVYPPEGRFIVIQDEWISVDDAMPNDQGCTDVLISVIDRNGHRWIPKVAVYVPQYSAWRLDSCDIRWISSSSLSLSVTHWMPLPKQPKEVSDEED